MRIAFASCMYLEDNDDQEVWKVLSNIHGDPASRFDYLALLGDQVYSGYGFADARNKPQLGWSDDQFLDYMYEEYSAQYGVQTFRKFLTKLRGSAANTPVVMTWDDHDFGYNNGYGQDRAFATKKAITGFLFDQFRSALKTLPTTYPAKPSLATAQAFTAAGPSIDEFIDLRTFGGKEVTFVMADTRWSCGQPSTGANAFNAGMAARISAALAKPNSLVILANGRPYAKAGLLSKQMWTEFADGAALVGQFPTTRNVIALAGDIHRNKLITHDGWYEVFSSGAAKGKKENFGVLSLNQTNVSIELFRKGGESQIQTVIPLANVGTANFTKNARTFNGPFSPLDALQEPVMVDSGERYKGRGYRRGYWVTNRTLTANAAGVLEDAGGIDPKNLRYFYTDVPWPLRSKLGNWKEVNEADFLRALAGEMEGQPDVLTATQYELRNRQHIAVVVHGFNKSVTSAETNLQALAERGFESQEGRAFGQLVSFDWASQSHPIPFTKGINKIKSSLLTGYVADKAKATQSAPQLASFLQKLRAAMDAHQAAYDNNCGRAPQPNRMQLTALVSSMGNYVMECAFGASAHAKPVLDNYIAAAADVEPDIFAVGSARGANIAAVATKVHVLYNANDIVLKFASACVYQDGGRLGYGPVGAPRPANVKFHNVGDWDPSQQLVAAHHIVYGNVPPDKGETYGGYKDDFFVRFARLLRGEDNP
jgi:esterase/lipase superfamily enzyme